MKTTVTFDAINETLSLTFPSDDLAWEWINKIYFKLYPHGVIKSIVTKEVTKNVND